MTEAIGYLEKGRDTYTTAADREECTATMLAAYPDYAGAFLLQLSVLTSSPSANIEALTGQAPESLESFLARTWKDAQGEH